VVNPIHTRVLTLHILRLGGFAQMSPMSIEKFKTRITASMANLKVEAFKIHCAQVGPTIDQGKSMLNSGCRNLKLSWQISEQTFGYASLPSSFSLIWSLTNPEQ
jgi:hypothetical protein